MFKGIKHNTLLAYYFIAMKISAYLVVMESNRIYRKWWITSYRDNVLVLTPLHKESDMCDDYFIIRQGLMDSGIEFYEDRRFIYEEKS